MVNSFEHASFDGLLFSHKSWRRAGQMTWHPSASKLTSLIKLIIFLVIIHSSFFKTLVTSSNATLPSNPFASWAQFQEWHPSNSLYIFYISFFFFFFFWNFEHLPMKPSDPIPLPVELSFKRLGYNMYSPVNNCGFLAPLACTILYTTQFLAIIIIVIKELAK